MRIAIGIVLSLVAVVGLIALIGFFLPVAHEASRTAEFNTPPAQVFALMSHPETYSQWWDGATVKSEVVDSAAPSKLVTKVVGETQFGGTWTIEIVPTQNGSRMTITERGEIYNLVFRTLSKFVFGYAGTMESCLEAAQKRLAAS